MPAVSRFEQLSCLFVAILTVRWASEPVDPGLSTASEGHRTQPRVAQVLEPGRPEDARGFDGRMIFTRASCRYAGDPNA